MRNSFNIVGIGEILWDELPAGRRLGGAPANFAYVAGALGNNAAILSRVGDDAAGRAILAELTAKNLPSAPIQVDPQNPTGFVKVALENGQPVYEIAESAAWDFLEPSDAWREVMSRADAVCFGSLAQRRRSSGRTIRGLVEAVKTWKIFDVNLRQNFYSPETLAESFNAANVAKLSADEMAVVAEMFAIEKTNPAKAARDLLKKFGLKLICLTRGADGSVLIRKSGAAEHAGLKIEVNDAVGAGDAFTAALAHGLVRRWRLGKINEFANRVGAYVASQSGAMPDFPEEFKS